jgi:hypothetical protein
MGKIRVIELARMMGVSRPDLIHKLRSIGIDVGDKGELAHIDSDIVQSILQQKSLPSTERVGREYVPRLDESERVGREYVPA